MKKHCTIIITFFLFFFSAINSKCEECPEIKGSLLWEPKARYVGYDIAYFENFTKEQQVEIFNKTKNKCTHIIRSGSSGFVILLKEKNSDTYIITRASRYDCNCPDWSLMTIDTITGDIPLISNGNNIKGGSNRKSVFVEFLRSNKKYKYVPDYSKGKAHKFRIK